MVLVERGSLLWLKEIEVKKHPSPDHPFPQFYIYGSWCSTSKRSFVALLIHSSFYCVFPQSGYTYISIFCVFRGAFFPLTIKKIIGQVQKGVKRKADTTTHVEESSAAKVATRRESGRPIKKPAAKDLDFVNVSYFCSVVWHCCGVQLCLIIFLAVMKVASRKTFIE